MESQRSKEDMNTVLAFAKLHPDDLSGISQALFFADDLSLTDNNKFVLLQLNEHVKQCLDEGKHVSIKGQPEEAAYLCTDDTTYQVLKSETSNSLLLANDVHFASSPPADDVHHVRIANIFNSYLELQNTRPSFDKLEAMLQATCYKGPEHEYEVQASELFTFDQLEAIVQASRSELQQMLAQMKAVRINGKMRLLDFEYHFRVLSFMLKLIEENSWHLDEVSYDVTMETLADLVPVDVLQAVFELYTIESQMRDGSQLYRYKELDVCRFFAEVLLHSAGKFNYREFMQAWQDSVPEGMHTKEEMLHGIAIVSRKRTPNVVFGFAEKNLSKNEHERFRELFSTKDKWTVEEITPYITSLTTDKLDVKALLTKSARMTKIDGVTYYSSKHNK